MEDESSSHSPHCWQDVKPVPRLNIAVTFNMSGSLPEPLKTQENLKKFVKIVMEDVRIRSQLLKLVSPDCECKRAEEAVVSNTTTVDNFLISYFLQIISCCFAADYCICSTSNYYFKKHVLGCMFRLLFVLTTLHLLEGLYC